MKKYISQKGLTLIELIVYLGILIILLGLLSAIIVTILRVQTQQASAVKVSSELNFAMNTIKADVRQASSSLSITSTTLAFTTDQTIEYSFSSNTLFKTTAGNKEALNGADIKVDNVTFQEYVSGSTQAVQVELTFSFNSTNPAQQAEQTLRSTVTPLR